MKPFLQTRWLSATIILSILIGCTKKSDSLQPVPDPVPPIVTPPAVILQTPRLITDSIFDLTLYSVTLGGRVADTGVSKLSDQGIVVGLSSSATVSSNFNKFSMPINGGVGFSKKIINLPANTTFYVRAYGINNDGVGYGNEITFTSGSEKVYQGTSTTLTTQQEVNEFGANNYTRVVNGLEIEGSGIHDLSPLKSIVILGGGLRVLRTSLVNLKGFENLEIIGNQFYNVSSIEDNRLLVSLSGLNNVKIINGPLQLVRNNALLNCEGLNNLTRIGGGGLGIYDCENIQNLDGLEKLSFMDGTLWLQRNSSLSNIKGLKSLSTLIDDVRIGSNPSLLSLDGLETLKKIRYVVLENNTSLADINGLRNLTELSGFQLDQSDNVTEISALNNLKTCEYVDITRNKALMNLGGLSNIETITGRLAVNLNPKLVNMSGLEKLHTARTININSNDAMKNLKGLDNLKVLTGEYSLGVGRNDALKSLAGLENLATATGQLYIGLNPSLSDFCALKKVMSTYTANSFVTEGNAAATDQNKILSTCP